MTSTMICPRCNKSREFYQIRECDPKTKKHWVITRCQKCSWNADIMEGVRETGITQRNDNGIIRPRPPDGGWVI